MSKVGGKSFYFLFICLNDPQQRICSVLNIRDADRLAGAALIAPVINYWWPSFPANMSREAYYKQPLADQWALRVVHHIPWLTYWWNTQKLFHASSVVANRLETFPQQDLEIIMRLSGSERAKYKVLYYHLNPIYCLDIPQHGSIVSY